MKCEECGDDAVFLKPHNVFLEERREEQKHGTVYYGRNETYYVGRCRKCFEKERT